MSHERFSSQRSEDIYAPPPPLSTTLSTNCPSTPPKVTYLGLRLLSSLHTPNYPPCPSVTPRHSDRTPSE
eukprot:3719750-Rhodomonas_salina.2